MVRVVLEFLKNSILKSDDQGVFKIVGYNEDETFRNSLSNDPYTVFDTLASHRFSAVLWNQKISLLAISTLQLDTLFTAPVVFNRESQNQLPTIESFKNYCINELEQRRPVFRIVLCHVNESDQFFSHIRMNPDLVDSEFTETTGNNFVFTKPFLRTELFHHLTKNSIPKFLTVLFEYAEPRLNRRDLVESMQVPLDGPISANSELFDYMRAVSAIPSDIITSRIFHVVQSSGSGKTKHGLELVSECKQGLYFVSRKGSSTGYPEQPSWINKFLNNMSIASNNIVCEYLWLKLIDAALTYLQASNANVSFESISNFLSSSERELDQVLFAEDSSDPKNIDSIAVGDLVTKIILSARKLKLTVESSEKETNPSNLFFPIIIDEADELLKSANDNCINLFRTLRRALGRLKSIRGLVAIFMGTKSAMKEFEPYNQDDSARSVVALGDRGENLFVPRPFVLSHNVDVFVHNIVVDHGSLEADKTVLYPDVIKFGRPLWANYKTLHEAIRIAAHKLELFDKEMFPLNALIMRACVTVSSQCELIHKMVQSGMATLLYVDPLGLKCFTTYIPEPVLSNAARRLLSNSQNMRKALADLISEMSSGVLQKGQAGELVARIVLLMAMDKDSGSDDLVLYKKVETFLSDFSGVSLPPSVVGLSRKLLDGFVSFSQFVNLETVGFTDKELAFEIGPELLLHAFIRCAALVLPVGADGADLIVPVLKSDNTMGCLVIQVKNLAMTKIVSIGSVKCANVVNKLQTNYLKYLKVSKNDCIPMVLQLKADPEPKNQPSLNWINIHKSPPCLWLFGLGNFRQFLDTFNEALLRDLLRGEFHFFKNIYDEPSKGRLTLSQNTKNGLLARLMSTNPLANKAFLPFVDDKYKEKYPEKARLVIQLEDSIGLKRREIRPNPSGSSISLASPH